MLAIGQIDADDARSKAEGRPLANCNQPAAFFVPSRKGRKCNMKLKMIVLANTFGLMSSLAFAQAPIGSSADFGNGAVINRGPVPTVGEDLDFRTNRSYSPRFAARHRRAHVRRGHSHLAEHRR